MKFVEQKAVLGLGLQIPGSTGTPLMEHMVVFGEEVGNRLSR